MKDDYVTSIKEKFQAAADPVKALPMKKYMKNLFEFLGITKPQRIPLKKEFLKKERLPGVERLEGIIKQLWELPGREYQYFGFELVEHYRKQLKEQDIDLLEYMITNKSWWDTVDFIAANLVGTHFKRFPHLVGPYTAKWLASGNMWLQRTALLFQLKYKAGTDVELMFQIIRQLADSKEFFIRKAIGWALREYSKTNPAAVIKFVESHPLSNLSKREALKVIARKSNREG
ncbi:MAG: DNA alkylation repair protein [Candidatus Aminicenantes bacterium]|nr:DNA alkylation repair protein [Candidatus Aminicenantes bacterium]